jgi:hypothetical protein
MTIGIDIATADLAPRSIAQLTCRGTPCGYPIDYLPRWRSLSDREARLRQQNRLSTADFQP